MNFIRLRLLDSLITKRPLSHPKFHPSSILRFAELSCLSNNQVRGSLPSAVPPYVGWPCTGAAQGAGASVLSFRLGEVVSLAILGKGLTEISVQTIIARTDEKPWPHSVAVPFLPF